MKTKLDTIIDVLLTFLTGVGLSITILGVMIFLLGAISAFYRT